MGILNLFKRVSDVPFQKEYRFDRIDSDYSVQVGDFLKIWNKPETEIIHLYAKGSSGGMGLIGKTIDKTLSHHLSNTKYLFVETRVIDVDDRRIHLDIKMYVDKEKVLSKDNEQRNKWLKLATKSYNPTSYWELRFFSNEDLNLDGVNVACISSDDLDKYYEHQLNSVWLIDRNGNKINAESQVRNNGIEKTLKAKFSGHELSVKHIVIEKPWHYIEIGIKSTKIKA